MTITVIINNYNYGQFLERAVASVRAQTRPCDQLVIVDDGSTDGSLEVARRCAATDPRICVISKANGGQLSAFNAGFKASSGEVICFLDADDEYLPDYLARLEDLYSQRPDIDFVFCQCEMVNGQAPLPSWVGPAEDRDYGLSFFRILLSRDWLGSPTSAVSARRSLLAQFLPCSLENQLRICADNVLDLGSSLCLGRKLHLGTPLVRYHVHGLNHFFDRDSGPLFRLQLRLRRNLVVSHLAYPLYDHLMRTGDVAKLILLEFSSIPTPLFRDARLYARMIRGVRGRGRWRYQMQVWLAWYRALARR